MNRWLATVLLLLACPVLAQADAPVVGLDLHHRGIEDLADGESRTFDVGDHELVVKRVGDDLTVVSDGRAFASFGALGAGHGTNIWVTEDGENIEIDGDYDGERARIRTARIGETVTEILHRSVATRLPTSVVADAMAEELFKLEKVA